MSVAAVRARMAALMLAPRLATSTRVGGFTLRPEQEPTLIAILRAVREFGGVLVADPPGTGKTVLALAAAHALGGAQHGGAQHGAPDGPSVLVLAPAALRAQWIDSAERAEVVIAFNSFESLSRRTSPRRAAIVIVDEAHHARTPTTRRYARLAECCLGARVLLLSATPVVNRAADRDALLALFLGARSSTLAPEELSQCVVRADAEPAPSRGRVASGRGHGSAGDQPLRPTVRRLGVIGRGAELPGLAEAISAMPPPLPLADGTHASALIAMSLAMAWRSSLAALDAALRRRIQRGEAMRDLLRSGHAPSRAMLKHWVLHDDATQLAMGALLAPAVEGGSLPSTEARASGATADALVTLDAHLRAVRDLRERIGPHRFADAQARATAIRHLARAHPDRRLVVFARHAETIRALYSALRAEPGVVAIVGSRVHTAAGRWTRDEVLRAIGPRARPLHSGDLRRGTRVAPRDAACAIRILLATDVVAEGIEMQGVGIVVHADIPWTPARLEQRLGRVSRAGSPHREVFEARLGAPHGARALIRLGARLQRKSEARDRALRDARAQARITTALSAWRSPVHASGACASAIADPDGDVTSSGTVCVGAVHADRDAFIAVVGDPPYWLAGMDVDGRWRISSTPRLVARLVGAARGEGFAPSSGMIQAHERRIARALERRAARTLTSPDVSAGDPAHATNEPAITRRRIAHVRARFARILVHTPALARAEIAARQSALLSRLSRPLELAREHRLDALLRAELDDPTFARRLGALLYDGDHRTAGGARQDRSDRTHRDDKSRPSVPGRLHCLLILSRASGLPTAPAPSPPSASPGTAAPH